MSEIEQTPVPDTAKIRGTITMTHKQAGVTGVSMATFFMILHFLNSNYASKADARAISEQLADVKSAVTAGFSDQKTSFASYQEDQISTHRRMMDTVRGEIAEEKTDRQNGDETVAKRVDLVMELFKIKHTKTN